MPVFGDRQTLQEKASRNEVGRVSSNPVTVTLLEEEVRTQRHTDGAHTKAWGGGGRLQVKARGLTSPADASVSDMQPPEC